MTRTIRAVAATMLIGMGHTLSADAPVPVEATRIDGSVIAGEWLTVDEPGTIGLRTKDRREIMSVDDLISLRFIDAFSPTHSGKWSITVWCNDG